MTAAAVIEQKANIKNNPLFKPLNPSIFYPQFTSRAEFHGLIHSTFHPNILRSKRSKRSITEKRRNYNY